MRRFAAVVCAMFAAIFFVSIATLSAEAQSTDQYEPSEGDSAPESPPPGETIQSTAPDTSGAAIVSQGSAVKTDSGAAKAAQADLAEEERLPDYSQVVDDTTKGRFKATGWKEQRGSDWSHGKSFVSAAAGSKAKPARFEVKVPSTSDYSVYAWWPDAKGNSGAARYGIDTASGTKWEEVDQSRDGGMWIKLGTYELKKGERSVQVAANSSGKGTLVADAVAIVRGEAVAPPEDQATAQAMASDSRATSTDSKATVRYGRLIVQKARNHIGDRYDWGTCTKSVKSCTCLTKKAANPLGHTMGMTENGQWKYSRSVRIPRSSLRAGDEVFFKENGPRGGITHVGIYAGRGMIVHASSYFGKVVEKQMKYINGYAGAKRFMQKG